MKILKGGNDNEKVGIIVGSVRPNRRSMQVANWLKVQLKKSGQGAI